MQEKSLRSLLHRIFTNSKQGFLGFPQTEKLSGKIRK